MKEDVIRLRKRLISFLFCGFISGVLFGQGNQQESAKNLEKPSVTTGLEEPTSDKSVPLKLSLEKSLEIALEKNLGVRAEAELLKSKKRSSNNSWNLFFPSVSTSFGLSYTKPGTEPTLAPGISREPWTYSYGVTGSLPLNFALYPQVKNLKLAYLNGTLSYDDVVLKLRQTLTTSYNTLLSQRANLELLRLNLKASFDRYNQSKLNFKNGLASELTMLQAQVNYELLRPQLADAETLYANNILLFKNSLQIPLVQEIELTDDLSITPYKFDPRELISTFLVNNISLQQSDINIRTLKGNRLALIGRNYTPSFTFSAGYNMNSPNTSSSTTWSNTGSFSLGISMPLDPLIPFSAKNVDLMNMENTIKNAQINRENLYDSLVTQVVNIIMRMETALTNVQVAELQVSVAEKSYELTNQAYLNGLQELLDVQDSQNQYLQTAQNRLTQNLNYLNTLAELETILNTPTQKIAEFESQQQIKNKE